MLILLVCRTEKLMYDFGKETYFDVKATGNKSTRDRTLIKLLNSKAFMASWISTILLSGNPDELCNRLKLLQQEKQAGNNSDIIKKLLL